MKPKTYTWLSRGYRVLSIIMILAMALAPTMRVNAYTYTDKPDYQPGETVTIFGDNTDGIGYIPGETVQVTVYGPLEYIQVCEGIADDTGAWSCQVVLNADETAIGLYHYVTLGLTSGVSELGNFTDLAIGTYDQCSNDDGDGYDSGNTGCRWINGNMQKNNSTIYEHDATVQRLWLTGLSAGVPTTITFSYGTTKGGKHAYDYLTTWNHSETWITDADRCEGITGCTGWAEDQYQIPDDPNDPKPEDPPQYFTIRNGDITAISAPAIASGAYTGDSETEITITFTPTSDQVVFWFGAHVSSTNVWEPELTAIDIPGSPYHVALVAMNGDSIGSRDNQMQTDAIVPFGTIIIVKDAVPNDGKDFPFTLTGPTVVAPFSLDDDADPTLPNSETFVVSAGIYAAAETPQTGWSLTSATCDDGSPVNAIDLEPGETITCTFVNTRDLGSLKIIKSFDPLGSGFVGTFAINYDCDDGTAHDGTANLAAGGSTTISGIPTGTQCTVSEPALPTAPTGWSWGVPSISPAQPVTINSTTVPVEVTVTNSITRDLGNFKITKAVTNPDGATLPAAFTGTYDCGVGYTGVWSVAAGGSQTITGIPTGNVCSVVETAPVAIPGFTWGPITYTPTTITISSKGGTFEIVVGNSITRDLGNFKITKAVTNPDGATLPAAFTGTYDCGVGYTGNWSVAAGGSQTITGIPTGNVCSVVETAPVAIPGFTWGPITYTPATITISSKGGTFEIVVGNSITRDRGSFKITKTVTNPDGATLPAAFTGTYDCGVGYTGNWSVAAGGSQTITGIPTGNVCSVVETAPVAIPGFTWGPITYTPTTITISSKGGTFEIVVGNSITRDRGSFKITKTVTNPDGATLPAAFTGTYDCGVGYTGNWSVAAGGSQTITGIPTGNVCSVVETAPVAIPGFTWGPITYTPTTITISSKGGTFEIVVGNSITRDLGNFKITKAVTNPDGATLPAAFTGTYDCGVGYTGNWSVAAGGSQTITGIPTGNVCSVVETAPVAIPGFTWGPITYTPATITISSKGGTFEIVVGNSITRDRGNLEVTKIVDWAETTPDPEMTFEICIQGPSFPAPAWDCKTIDFDGGVLTWTNLFTGSYLIKETALDTWWMVSITGSPATVTLGGTAHATVTNTHRIWSFTPGFWKNHTEEPRDAWKYTAYNTSDTLGGVFTELAGTTLGPKGSIRSFASLTLLEALSLKGGSNLPGALEILLRAGTAALLNASFHEEMHGTVEGYYPYTSAEVIALVNEQVLHGDRASILALAYDFDDANNGEHYIEWWWEPGQFLP